MLPGIPRIKPEIAGKAADFAYGSADEMDDFLYHVTTEPNAKKILKEGFKGGAGKSLFGGSYAGHSKGKVFVTDIGSVGYWRIGLRKAWNRLWTTRRLGCPEDSENTVGELFPDEAAGIAASSYWFKPYDGVIKFRLNHCMRCCIQPQACLHARS